VSVVLTAAEREEALALIARLGVLLSKAEDTPAPIPGPVIAPAPAGGLIRCDVAAIRAVDEVESNGKGFGADGRPIILFEPHVFSRLTNHRFDSTHGGVSYAKWGAKPYKKTQAERWDQLLYAAKLDEGAAYKSASYGRFQIMGFNHASCAFPTVGEFVEAMKRSERDQLQAFCQFVLFNKLDDEIREHRWEAFAERFNGPQHAKHNYAGRMAAAHAKHSGAAQ
jgi:hypothetical protein